MLKIEGNRSIVTGSKTLIKASSSFVLSPTQLEELSDKELVRGYYRRFFRLRPFISSRKTIKETYTEYLRYKFKVEDYGLKRAKFLKKNEILPHDHKAAMKKSLEFILKGVSITHSKSQYPSDDETFCRKIFKNLLTVEYHKDRLANRSQRYYQCFRRDFSYVTEDQNISLKHFEENLIRLNETLGTQL